MSRTYSNSKRQNRTSNSPKFKLVLQRQTSNLSISDRTSNFEPDFFQAMGTDAVLPTPFAKAKKNEAVLHPLESHILYRTSFFFLCHTARCYVMLRHVSPCKSFVQTKLMMRNPKCVITSIIILYIGLPPHCCAGADQKWPKFSGKQ